ncbi:hypothetical protein COV04_02820 [Candidatus Uhrbacteria bacterium CG10_big_fil_rev_8_21_14_0_10_48_11]|uniref:Uncharacterized protein n=1 Tax=Candidatus Uhrbacteria bacterium CG10_big_fil_rev_8_21_14_0_10_48_11 TaxID=1975037 RepID=A0A2M8LEG8_9BACT|nr:MAG: hypothetical protein COV04_02820 [Candidatus Uhrbacteria bacterium CG10_big_fil_rev_8_21_14_0_10_48_11]
MIGNPEQHKKYFVILLAWFFVYIAAELFRPGMVSGAVDLFLVALLLFCYGPWIVLYSSEGNEPKRLSVVAAVLVSLLAGVILLLVTNAHSSAAVAVPLFLVLLTALLLP